MNHWIVVTGAPGSGKSSLRQRLADTSSAQAFDIIDYYPRHASFDVKESALAFSRLKAEILKQGRRGPRIIEAMFYQSDRRNEILQCAKDSGARVIFVHLDADLACLQKRVAKRVDVFEKPLTDARVKELHTRFQDFEGDLRFRTDQQTVDEIVATINRHLRRDDFPTARLQ